MTSYDISSFSELTAALENASSLGADASIILNCIGNFTDTPVPIDIPANVSDCTINGDIATNPSPVYNSRILTARSGHFELTLNNLNLKITDDNPVIDIAKTGVTIGEIESFNKLTLSGTNLIENNYLSTDMCTNTCGIYIGNGTGLDIVSLANSSSTVNTIVNGTEEIMSSSAAIGGKIGGASGTINLIVDGRLGVNSIFSSSAQSLSSTGAGIGGGGASFMSSGGNGGNISISGTGTLNVTSTCNGEPIFASGAGIGGGGAFMRSAGLGGIIVISGDVNVVSLCINNGLAFSSMGAGIGGGGSNSAAGTGGNITITDRASVISKSTSTSGFASIGAGIGGGGSNDGNAGDSGTITISSEASVNSSSENTITNTSAVGAGIGGGGSYSGSAGSGSTINILGYSHVNSTSSSIYDSIQGTSGVGAGIGGGGSYSNVPGGGGTIKIYDSAIVTSNSIGSSGAGIGGGSNGSSSGTIYTGNSGTIKIYGSANVTASAEGYGAGIGSGGFIEPTSNILATEKDNNIPINALENDDIKIKEDILIGGNPGVSITEQAVIYASSESGIGIYVGPHESNDKTTYGYVEINTSGSVTVPENTPENFAIAVIGFLYESIIITKESPKDILGGISGEDVIVADNKIVVDKLRYYYLSLDNGYIIVNDPDHIQHPPDRGDYEILDLSEKGIPYTDPVLLKDAATDVVIGEIATSDTGTVRMYLSDGEYYITESLDENYKTETFSVTSTTPHTPEQELPLTSDTARFTGVVEWTNDTSGTSGAQQGVMVTLYDSKMNRTTYGAVTDEYGKYAIYGVEPGTYYEGFSNRPTSYSFVEDDVLDKCGITKTSFTVAAEDEQIINAALEFNKATIGEKGERGIPGASGIDGVSFPSSSINMFKFERQSVKQKDEVNLGSVVEGNGNAVWYSPADNSIVLNKVGIFMVNFSTNASYIYEHSKNDYLSLQLKLGDNFINHGFAYSWDRGILYCSALVKNNSLKDNKLKLINVGTQEFNIDNLRITVLNIS